MFKSWNILVAILFIIFISEHSILVLKNLQKFFCVKIKIIFKKSSFWIQEIDVVVFVSDKIFILIWLNDKLF